MRILVVKELAARASAALNQRLLLPLAALGHRVVPVDVIAFSALLGHEGAQQLVLQHARAYHADVVLCCPPYDMLALETCHALTAMGVPVIGWRCDDPTQLATLTHRPTARQRYLRNDGDKFTLNATTSRSVYEAMGDLGISSAA